VKNPEAAAELQRSAAREQELSQSVADGRAALAKGDLGAARRAFEQAAQLDRGGSESSFWLQRLEIAEGSHESVLSKLSRQRREGKAGPDEAYLQALALEALANEQLRSGGSGVGLMLEDAFNALEPVSEAGGERYRDVHLPLARTARQLGRHSVGEAAARRALEVDANSSEAAGLLGRALLGQLAALPNDEGSAEERKRLYTEAVKAFEGALKSLGERPEGQAGLSAAAEIWNQLGTAHAFGQDTAAAGKAYAQAIGFDPALVDLGAIYNTLGAAEFARTCEAGSAEFVKRAGAKDARDATTQWWLGFALFSLNEPEKRPAARTAFKTALEKYPAYLNSLYYLARLDYDDQQYPGAIAHLADYWQRAPEGLVLMLGDDTDVLRIEYMIGTAIEAKRHDQAILLSRILCQARPQNSRFWNNLGLFLRDDGDIRASKLKPNQEAELGEIMAQWEESLVAYEKALALEPKNPAYLNDTGVILHYNLRRDYERALALYAEANTEATRLLDAGGLDADTKSLYTIAQRDSRNNRKALESQIAKEKKEREEKAKKEADAGSGSSGSGGTGNSGN
jgi:tetratricopeptide (TPR) repeat protein